MFRGLMLALGRWLSARRWRPWVLVGTLCAVSVSLSFYHEALGALFVWVLVLVVTRAFTLTLEDLSAHLAQLEADRGYLQSQLDTAEKALAVALVGEDVDLTELG